MEKGILRIFFADKVRWEVSQHAAMAFVSNTYLMTKGLIALQQMQLAFHICIRLHGTSGGYMQEKTYCEWKWS